MDEKKSYRKGLTWAGCYYQSGQVYKMDAPQKDKKSKFRLMLRYFDEPSQKWKALVSVRWCKNQTEAIEQLKVWHEEKEAEHSPETVSKELTLADTMDAYIANRRDIWHVQASTTAYHGYMAGHVPQALRDKQLDMLTQKDGETWLKGIQDEDGTAGAYDRKCFKFVKATLAWARKNPDYKSFVVDPWEALPVPDAKAGRVSALDPHEARRLYDYLQVMPATTINTAVALALFAGLRESEAAALKFEDVDFDARRLHVSRAIGRAGAGVTYIKSPKSRASDRYIPISEPLMRELVGRRKQVADKLAELSLPEEAIGSMYVCGNLDRYTDPHDLGKQWRGVANSLELKGTDGTAPHFHDLRKSLSSLGYEATHDTKAQDTILGHGSESLALNVYTVSYEKAQRAFVDGAVEQMLAQEA